MLGRLIRRKLLHLLAPLVRVEVRAAVADLERRINATIGRRQAKAEARLREAIGDLDRTIADAEVRILAAAWDPPLADLGADPAPCYEAPDDEPPLFGPPGEVRDA